MDVHIYVLGMHIALPKVRLADFLQLLVAGGSEGGVAPSWGDWVVTSG